MILWSWIWTGREFQKPCPAFRNSSSFLKRRGLPSETIRKHYLNSCRATKNVAAVLRSGSRRNLFLLVVCTYSTEGRNLALNPSLFRKDLYICSDIPTSLESLATLSKAQRPLRTFSNA